MTQASRSTRFGPVVGAQGVNFRLWAPSTEDASLLLSDSSTHSMVAQDDGFFEVFIPDIGIGQRYAFEIAGHRVPDPASRLQDQDIFDWSVVCGSGGSNAGRSRRPWHESIVCEIHVGTASPEGTFNGLAGRLPALANAGYSVIELMPIGDFPGKRNWGYDGVLPFAPDRRYGTPDELRALIAKAHELGLSMILDVVYNHFGPSGNFLHLYATNFFSKDLQTPWGAAINLDDPMVRLFFVENARMWIEEFGFDGLRFDAVHAFPGAGGDLLLREIAEAVRDIAPEAFLVLENDHNAANWLERTGSRPRYFDAQWNDDYHHVFHVLATGETCGYYGDYQADPVGAAARIMAEGFCYQGEPSNHRGGRARGQPSGHLHPTCFVSFLQNHDQIGNRAFGERLVTLIPANRAKLLQFSLLLSPEIPLFFMGEEFGARTQFLYFCDFDGELADAVREGRKLEFKSFEDLTHNRAAVSPDPNDIVSFEKSRLAWDELRTQHGQVTLEQFRALVKLRRETIIPLLGSAYQGAESYRHESAIGCRWAFAEGSIALGLNPSDSPVQMPVYPEHVSLATVGTVASQGQSVMLGPWSGIFWGRQ